MRRQSLYPGWVPVIDSEAQAFAAGTKNLGQSFGDVIDAAGRSCAALWTSKGTNLLPELSPSAPFSQASRSKDAGLMVGRAARKWAPFEPGWNSLQAIDFGTLSGGGDSFAADVNEQGVVARSSDAEVETHEFTQTIQGGFVNYGNPDPPFRLAVAGIHRH